MNSPSESVWVIKEFSLQVTQAGATSYLVIKIIGIINAETGKLLIGWVVKGIVFGPEWFMVPNTINTIARILPWVGATPKYD